MSMVARTEPGPAEDDITDTDDGDTRALILERYRDADTTDKGDRRADALDIQTSDLWRDVSWAISDILCRPRIFAELC
ncbi:head completion/stabilization protein [Escherichia coli]|nr:head completion/stabilization protein [Escherichia coli]